MPERLTRDYRHAKMVTRVGALALHLITILSVCICLVIAALIFDDEGFGHTPHCLILSLIGMGVFAIATFCLAEFLRHFGLDQSPFGKEQSARLLVAAVLLAIKTVVDMALPTLSQDPSPSADLVFRADIDLKVVAVVVFLVCLAMVVRYGDALKEDSDAFV